MQPLRFVSVGFLFVVTLALASGCGDDDGPGAGTDAARADGGSGTGDGGRVDAGSIADAAATDSGASEDAAIVDDGGPFTDSGREGCDAAPTFECATGTSGGACGDALSMPVCVAGAWQCPVGTIDARLCACLGRPPGSGCTCTPSGWVCDSDGGAASCAGDPGACFACGPTIACVKNAEYCQEVSGGAAGSSPSYSCLPLPDSCGAMPTCACIASGGGTFCSADSDGNITVRVLAP